MRTFDEEVARLGAIEGDLRGALRKQVQELFRDFYPRLTDEQIEQELRRHGRFDDFDVRVVQAFYRTASYPRAIERLGGSTGQAGIRTRVMRALDALPEDSQLHVALTMSYKHRGLYDEETT